jgi:hypothetical protein
MESRRTLRTASEQCFLALIDPADGRGFGVEWPGEHRQAVIVDDVDSRGANAVIWRFQLEQLHSFPALLSAATVGAERRAGQGTNSRFRSRDDDGAA